MKVLITGATGFIGRWLIRYLFETTTYQLQLIARKEPSVDFNDILVDRANWNIVEDISNGTDWSHALTHVEVVIHTAGRAHIMQEHAQNPMGAYRAVNVQGTLNLAQQAAKSGVKRFIFLSTIKVNGESSSRHQPFREIDCENPSGHYACSKYEAEQRLIALAKETGMEVVIIRPVLVYGPGVKGNFKSMLDWLQHGKLLPLGHVKNKRSFVAIENLVDFITICINHPMAANQTFLVSDGEDLSITTLLKKLLIQFNHVILLLPIPISILKILAFLFKKQIEFERLCGFLQVDISKARQLLNWSPPVSVDQALCKTVTSYFQTFGYMEVLCVKEENQRVNNLNPRASG